MNIVSLNTHLLLPVLAAQKACLWLQELGGSPRPQAVCSRQTAWKRICLMVGFMGMSNVNSWWRVGVVEERAYCWVFDPNGSEGKLFRTNTNV